LIPLHGYQQARGIAASSLPLIAAIIPLPAELIDLIQSLCSKKDLLLLTSIDKAAYETRVYNLRLQQLSLKTVEDTKQFLVYCRASQKREAQDLSADDTQKSRKRLKSEGAEATLLATPFTKENLQWVTTLTLTVSDQSTEQYELLFSYLSRVQHLTVHSTISGRSFLCSLLHAAQNLPLRHLAVINNEEDEFYQVQYAHGGAQGYGYGEIKDDYIVENHREEEGHFTVTTNYLPDELWQLTTLETLILDNFIYVDELSTEIGQLSNLTSLTLKNMPYLYNLPDNIGQLNALRSLTLEKVGIFRLPDTLLQLGKLETLILRGMRCVEGPLAKINELQALKHLELQGDRDYPTTLPSTLGQLESLETLILEELHLAVLPDEIGQCTALKSLHFINLYQCDGLPTTLAQLDKLETVVIKGRGFEAFPDVLTLLPALKLLELIKGFSLDEVPEKLRQVTKVVSPTNSRLSINSEAPIGRIFSPSFDYTRPTLL
jgi:Leucine-rich repeat (LRR) protein